MNESKRLFIALQVDAASLPQIEIVMKKLRVSFGKKEIDVKWHPFSNLHITLQFLGESPVDKIEPVTMAIQEVCASFQPFTLFLSRLGAFSDEHHARVVWMGVQRKKELVELREAIVAKMAVLGFSPPDENFIPHMTLGRLRNPKSVKGLISPWVRKDFGKVEVTGVCLYESVLQQNFPKYIRLRKSILVETCD